jgi:hypothetical protein
MHKVEITKPRTENKREQPARTKAMKKRKMKKKKTRRRRESSTFTLSSGSSNDRADLNLSLSPSDDLFFKGRLVPIEPSSLVFNPSEPNSKQQQLFPVSLLKSATKFTQSKTTANATSQKTELYFFY